MFVLENKTKILSRKSIFFSVLLCNWNHPRIKITPSDCCFHAAICVSNGILSWCSAGLPERVVMWNHIQCVLMDSVRLCNCCRRQTRVRSLSSQYSVFQSLRNTTNLEMRLVHLRHWHAQMFIWIRNRVQDQIDSVVI